MNFSHPGKLKLLSLLLVLAALACVRNPLPAVYEKALLAGKVHYVNAEIFKSAEFAPPPASDSEAQKADITVIMDWQKKRTQGDCERSAITAKSTYSSFWGAKSPFREPLPVEVSEFFGKIASDLETGVAVMKNRYRRPRPYVAYSEAAPCIKKSRGLSYPSGHSSFARVFANVLCDIVPGRRSEFMAKADEIAVDRVIGGVHYPTDIAAGKVFGDLYHSELLKNPEYRGDIEKMKTFLVR